MKQPTECKAPAGSWIEAKVPGSYFHDAWSIDAAEPALDALSQFVRVARRTPRWIDAAMRARNRIVALFGIRNLGALSELREPAEGGAYQPGDRVGIFTLLSLSENEVLLGDSDKHLDVVVSVHRRMSEDRQAAEVTVTTVVKVYNWLGRAYMLPVRPAHRVIARAMVRAVGQAA